VNSIKIDSNHIVCRAFRKLPHILNISRENCIKKHKIIVMKGKNAQKEINNTSQMRNYEYRLENSITDNDSKIIILNAE
jgi:16S rRNA G527 N7-methylase RsmG